MFLLEVGKRKLVPLLLHCAALAIAGYLIRFGLIHFLSTSPVTSTAMFEHHFQSNLNFVLSTFRGNPEALRMLMTFGGLWIALPFFIHKANREHLRLVFLLPLFYIVMLIVGNMSDEARIFSEMIPLITTVIISSCKLDS